MTTPNKIIFVGGGLSAILAAIFLHRKDPKLNIEILESGKLFENNQTWSFHRSDLSDHALETLKPFFSQTWSSYDVKFPDFERAVDLPYISIRSKDLKIKLPQNIIDMVRENVSVDQIDDVKDAIVVDARGYDQRFFSGDVIAYQKFAGLFLRTKSPHAILKPTIMDATVTQNDGYRFIYTLPFDANNVLFEDTYYSDCKNLDLPNLFDKIHAYARANGLRDYEVSESECGALPIPLSGNYLAHDSKNLQIGMRGGFFHPTTGFSFPYAVQVGERLANLNELSRETIAKTLTDFREILSKRNSFFYGLNRMLFRACDPDNRWKILQQFYELNLSTVEHFYSGSLTMGDKMSVLSVKTPVSLFRGLSEFTNFARKNKNEGMLHE